MINQTNETIAALWVGSIVGGVTVGIVAIKPDWGGVMLLLLVLGLIVFSVMIGLDAKKRAQ